MSSKPPSLTTDRHNANRGTERGKKLVRKSLEDVGPGRSILLDRNEVVIAGNKTLEQAQALGIPVRIVKSDGKHLIAVQRTDLDLEEGDKARLAAFYDNRTAEVGLEWEEDELRAAVEQGIKLGDMWTPE